LKTTLVRVSCIQNTQIRGETTSKVFGKVALVEKRLLVAHYFGLCVVYMGCATIAMSLVTIYQWRISICGTHRQIMRGAYWLYAPLVAFENSKKN
jgi:hypothetical protein